jgi:hypothetical protein
VIRASDVERAVRAIHDKFNLAEEAVMREAHPSTVTGEMRALRAQGDATP